MQFANFNLILDKQMNTIRRKISYWFLWAPFIIAGIWFLVSTITWWIGQTWSAQSIAQGNIIRWVLNWALWMFWMVSILLFITWIALFATSWKKSDISNQFAESSIKEWRSRLKASFWKWFLVMMASFAILFAWSLLVESTFSVNAMIQKFSTQWWLPITDWIWTVVVNLLQVVLSSFAAIWMFSVILDTLRWVTIHPTLKWYFDRKWRIVPYVMWTLLFFIISMILWWIMWFVFGTLSWSFSNPILWLIGVTLVVVVLVYCSIRLKYRNLFILDRGYWVIESFKASWRITKWYFWEIILLQIYQLLIQIPWFLALVVWLFATIPTAIIADVDFYTKLLPKNIMIEQKINDIL